MRWDRLLGAIAHPFTEYQVTKAKRAHRAVHPRCLVCNRLRDPVTGKQNDVHHLVPVHIDPSKATEPGNLGTMCRLHHFLVGHRANWKDYNRLVGDDARDLARRYCYIIGGRWQQ